MPRTLAGMPLHVRILGPLTVEVDGRSVSIGGERPRGVLARLAASAPTAVRSDQLIEAVWGDDAPTKAMNTLQVHVSNLRRVLGTNAAGDPVVRTEPNGYSLAVGGDELDLLLFEELVQRARAERGVGQHEQSARSLAEALAIPTGEPLADLLDNEWAVAESRVLAGRIDGVWREWATAELAAGNHVDLLPSLVERRRAAPLDEGLAAMVVLALYRSGRQTDALRVLADVRRSLADEIGVDPGPELAELENRILAHDPRLLIGRAAAAGGPAQATRVAADSDVAVLSVGARRHRLSADLVTIGRDGGQQIVIDDDDVSREHALIERRPSGFRLSDRHSTNGTWVNGVRIDEIDLHDGDEIWLGSTVAVFQRSTTGPR